jgi:hypothetical protein
MALVGQWTFNSGDASDSSGNGGTGTPSGSPVFSGGTLTLDGVDDYVNIPNSTALNIGGSALTVSAWWQFQSTGNYQCLVSKNAADGSHNSPYFNYMLGCLNSNLARFYVGLTGGTSADASGGSALTVGEWYHLAGVADGSSRIYLNGSLLNSVTMGGDTIRQSTSSLRIGAHGNVGELAKGTVDDVRVYDHVLSGADITALYNAGRGVVVTSTLISRASSLGTGVR